MEPVSMAIGAAGAGAVYIGGKIFEKLEGGVVDYAFDAIAEKVKDNYPVAHQKWTGRISGFKEKLNHAIGVKMESGVLNDGNITGSLQEPDYNELLADAIKASGRTDNEDIHRILADIVTDRMASGHETSFAMSLKIAVETIHQLNINHIKLCALIHAADSVRPDQADLEKMEEPKFVNWFKQQFLPLMDASVRDSEVNHLIAARCAFFMIGAHDSFSLKTPSSLSKVRKVDDLDELAVILLDEYQQLREVMAGPLTHTVLTPAGELIGWYAVAHFTGARPNSINWD